MLTLRYVVAISVLLFDIYVAVNGVEFPLCILLDILRWKKEQMVANRGVLVTFQDSKSTGTTALISYMEPNNMKFLYNHLPGVKLAGKHSGDRP